MIVHNWWGFLGSEVRLEALVTPALWPAPDLQDSVSPGGKWSASVSLSQWPALSGGSAIHSGHRTASLLQGPHRRMHHLVLTSCLTGDLWEMS